MILEISHLCEIVILFSIGTVGGRKFHTNFMVGKIYAVYS